MKSKKNQVRTRNTRRSFLKSSGALAAGMYLAQPCTARAEGDILALKGGPKAVTASLGDATKWPLYGKEEEEAVLEDACHAHGASMHGKPMGSWGRMACFSFQASKPLPAIEGGIGNYQNKEDYERATILGHYECAKTFPSGSEYGKYGLTGLGFKLRMHPMAAALARCQLKKLPKRNADGTAQVRRLNDRLIQLPGLYEQQNRSDVERTFYLSDRFLFNETEAGMSREACIKALKAEGVSIRAAGAQFQCDAPAYHEPQWWHHLPIIADRFPGAEEADRRGISLPYFTKDVPELVDQYIAAFEKVWAHRKELAS